MARAARSVGGDGMSGKVPSHPSDADRAAAVDAAIEGRRSVRAFLERPVPRALVERVLEVASRAPSGSNIQPWRVYVLTGERKAALTRELTTAYDTARDDPDSVEAPEYVYYPRNWFEPYIGRRRELGWSLYSLLEIGKGDFEKSHAYTGGNYRFFGAPVGLMFTIDRRLEIGSWLDYGMFIQNVMIAARGHGLETCPQQAFCRFHRIVARHIGQGEHEMLLCGMSMGYADESAVVNRLRPTRAGVGEFTTFLD